MKTWESLLENEHQQDYFLETLDYVKKQRASGVNVFPPEHQVFSAFEYTPFDEVKVVIIGQDPYHGYGQAHGLCFSVMSGTKFPPSLVNIYKELQTDIEGFTPPTHGNLETWAEQGVLLLNTVLTVEEGKAHSHKSLGWERYTDKIIALINSHLHGVVFVLWGAHAQKKGKSIDKAKHHVLSGPHPSPLSAYRGFFGCRHFSAINELLNQQGKEQINWQI